MTTDLFIIAAGNGSRMGGTVPKALVPLADGEPNLTTMLRQVKGKVDDIYVVTNELIQDQWDTYFEELGEDSDLAEYVINVPIKSGRGDGHAVMTALDKADSTADDVIIIWGDVFIPDARLIDELLEQRIHPKHPTAWGIVPVVHEKNPYVTIKVNDRGAITRAEFSKFGETNEEGYHDQSIFRFDQSILKGTLQELHAFIDKGGKYITANGEMSLLHIFHSVYNTSGTASPELLTYETDYPTLSFNTIEEVAAIQQEIKSKWQNQFSLP